MADIDLPTHDDISPDGKEIKQAYNWLGDHGQPSYEQLIALAQSGNQESLEQLRQLAEDNNITYSESSDPTDLAEQIYSGISENTQPVD